jgi:hypothetical protein
MIIINHYEILNGKNNQLHLLFYFLNHLTLLDCESTSFLSQQVSFKHLPRNIIKIYNIKRKHTQKCSDELRVDHYNYNQVLFKNLNVLV